MGRRSACTSRKAIDLLARELHIVRIVLQKSTDYMVSFEMYNRETFEMWAQKNAPFLAAAGLSKKLMTQRILVHLLCVVCFFVADDAHAQSDSDNQQWTEVQLAAPVTSAIDFNILGHLRLGRDISHPVEERVGVGFTFRFGEHVTFAPHYWHIGTQPFEGRRGWENRLVFPVTFKFNLGDFTLSDRNQFERRYRSTGARTNRYRNRVQVEHPVGADRWNLSVFVSDEVFYDTAVDRWVRNRFAIGASKEFNKHFTQEFYYLRQNDAVSSPGDLNVIGTTLRIKL